MIELGKIQTLTVVRHSDFGVYLNTEDQTSADVLLPKGQVPAGTEIGDTIEVFIYKDSEDRIIATVRKPKVTVGEVAVLTVVGISKIGAFLDWGLEKDLFLPFKQQLGTVEKGQSVVVGVYVDKTERLCGTMKVYDLLSAQSPYKKNQSAKGFIYQIKKDLGALVAVDQKYHGLIPPQELIGEYRIGDEVEVRVKNVKPDGKLELSLRKQAYYQMETDAQKLMKILEGKGGNLPFHDKTAPEIIKRELGMSKASFKRAVGRLLKEGAITLTDEGIKRNW